MRKFIFIFLFFTFIFNFYSYTNISSCSDDPSTSGEWRLNQDINITTGDCLDVGSNNILIDCQGFLINSSGANPNRAIDFNSFDNVTVKNCNIMNFNSGTSGAGVYILNSDYPGILDSNLSLNYNSVFIQNSNYGVFENINTSYNFQNGIGFHSGDFNNFTNIVSNNNSDHGIDLQNSATYSIFRNIEVNGNNYGVHFGFDSRNNYLQNLEATGNNYGVYLSRDSDNNSILNGDLRNNIIDNLYFHTTGGEYPKNNSFTNLYLGIGDNVGGNFNFTNLSSNNDILGNYFDDFNSSIHPPYCYTSGALTWSFCDTLASIGPVASTNSALSSVFSSFSIFSIFSTLFLYFLFI